MYIYLSRIIIKMLIHPQNCLKINHRKNGVVMEEIMGGSSGSEANAKTGLEGTGLDLPPNRHGNLKSASSDQNFKDILMEIKTSKTPAVINYGASWCRVCSQILPSFSRLSNNFPKLSFIYTDIDECPETTQHIRYTPTFQFYRDGERVDEMYGAGEERLHDRLWLHS